MHALVEYETSQQAEKAVEKLNDERNWRKGLRVRTVLRRSVRTLFLQISIDLQAMQHQLLISVLLQLHDFVTAQVSNEAEAA